MLTRKAPISPAQNINSTPSFLPCRYNGPGAEAEASNPIGLISIWTEISILSGVVFSWALFSIPSFLPFCLSVLPPNAGLCGSRAAETCDVPSAV